MPTGTRTAEYRQIRGVRFVTRAERLDAMQLLRCEARLPQSGLQLASRESVGSVRLGGSNSKQADHDERSQQELPHENDFTPNSHRIP